jgi:serine/threonine protein kinase
MDNKKKVAAEALNKSNLLPGRTFEAKDFVPIGAGNFGDVFAVDTLDSKLGRLVIKVLGSEQKADSGEIIYQQFCSSIGDKLSPHLVPTFYADSKAIIMKHFRGRNLTPGGNKKDPEEQKMVVENNVMGLIEGLKCLHDNGIAHLDVKPENIMYNENKEIAYVDFGSSRRVSSDGSDGAGCFGTLSYWSPETNDGEWDYKKSDVWALGITMLKVLTGVGKMADNSGVMLRFAKYSKGNYDFGNPVIISLIIKDVANNAKQFQDFIEEEIESINPPLENRAIWKHLLRGC